MPYLVVYEMSYEGKRKPDMTLNVILRNTHPVVWAANPPEASSNSGLITRLRFFAEIPEYIANDPTVAKWCGIEE